MTLISPNSRAIVPENVLVQELDGEAVLLDLKSETYFGLDEVGMRMWHVLITSPSTQDACKMLLDEYDVSSENLENDLNTLLEQLVKQGLLDIRNE
jgi:hypothetical protein